MGSSAFAFSGLREIRYAGTKEEWENIRKGALWNDHVPAKKVICTDGDVELENNATDIAPAVDIVSIGVDSESKMVTIPGTDYMMGQTPVTQRLYQKVMGVNPSYYQLSNEKLREDQRKALEEEGNTSNNPVEWITWYDALYFCNKLSMMEGLTPAYSVNGKTDPKCWDYTPHHQRGEDIDFDVDFDCTASGYRLPTKYEWNYAARGGENYIYSGSNDLDKVGWYSKNSKNVTHPVAQKLANGYGLYDMSGNVSEWGWGAGTSSVVDNIVGAISSVVNCPSVLAIASYPVRVTPWPVASITVQVFASCVTKMVKNHSDKFLRFIRT